VAKPTSEVVELIQELIRNRCVNDGTPGSGGEARNADLLRDYLGRSGLGIERYESAPGRSSLVARIEGTDPGAPSLCWLAHTDVVPVNEERWERDPFGGDLVDGYVWGRGAIDMFNLTASFAVALKRLDESGFRPRGTLIFAAVADEEAGGRYGAGYLTKHEADAVRCDYLITESGGFPLASPNGIRLPFLAEEKGPLWANISVSGTPGHAALPYGTDNAVEKAGEIIRRLSRYRPRTRVDAAWREFVEGLGIPGELAGPLLNEDGLVEALGLLPAGLSKMAYSCTHTTITPTSVVGGTKNNVIPDKVTIALDIRVLPGDGAHEVRAMIDDALGDLSSTIRLDFVDEDDVATSSPKQSPLVDSLQEIACRFYPGAQLLPMRMVGTTDARHFRRDLGTAAYGFGLFSDKISLDQLATMGHGDNERIDTDSLEMSTNFWEMLARDFLA
jgi:acetylornithine deacetylase/succinyl-diaminopimelate desuccinylase-like protein